MNTADTGNRGIIFDIQRAAIHDGPGIRTTVFLKGCPLRCAWCHNPESQNFHPERGKSGKVYGWETTTSDIMRIVRRDIPFYARSGGGITLSGGEPTAQPSFCKELLRKAKQEGISTCLDTCGHTSYLKEMVPWVDLFLFDLKLFDRSAHQTWTGVDGELIKRNFMMLQEMGCDIIVRSPIVPGVNDTEEHEAMLASLERSGNISSVERLPYHDTGAAKWKDLERSVPTF
jgi:pyruvate formate lyase activating enzyme